MDYMLKTKPNVTTLAVEARIIFMHNKTVEWLKKKDDASLKDIFNDASKNTKKMRHMFKKRHQEIVACNKKKVEEKLQKAEESRQRQLKLKEKYTNAILDFGLWQSGQMLTCISIYP